MLKLDGSLFQLDSETRDSALFVHEKVKGLEYSIELLFKIGDFNGEIVTPSLTINWIETTAKSIPELIGKTYTINNIKDADEREDTFYLYEHEPMKNYHLVIPEISGDKAHIKCTGMAIIDGYAEPIKTGKFKLDCWLPIITKKTDWEKFGL